MATTFAALPSPEPAAGANWSTLGNAHYVRSQQFATAINAAENQLARHGAGIVDLDEPRFVGASDAVTFQNAMNFAASQTKVPWIRFPDRDVNLGSTSFVPYDGMKLLAPGCTVGVKNLELGVKYVPHRVIWNGGSGASSMFNGTGTYRGINMAGLAFQSTNGTSQFFRSTGNVYPAEFCSLAFDGWRNVFGNETEKFLGTQVDFTGHWTVLNFSNTPLWFGGSEFDFWGAGYLNLQSPASVAGAGKPLMCWDYVQKSRAGFLYLTVDNDWSGLRVLGGGPDRANKVFGGTYEGRAADDPATRPVIDIRGGTTVFYSPWIGHVDDTANSLGAVHQSGGRLVMYAPDYLRADPGVTAAFPFLYQTGGTAFIDLPNVCTTGEQLRIRWSTTTTDTVALPTNGYRA